MEKFPVSVILSVTTGRLFCDMSELYRVLEAATGSPMMTHVLPRAGEFATPKLLAQYPHLAQIELPKLDGLSSADKALLIKGWAFQVDQKYQPLEVPTFAGWASYN